MKLVSAVLGTALVAVSGYTVHLSRELGAVRAHLAQLDAASTQAPGQADSSVDPARVAPTQTNATGTVAVPGRDGRPVAQEPAAADLLAMVRAQATTPEGLARRRDSSRTTIRMTHPGIEEALGLSPEELDRLIDLLVIHQERSSAVFEAARSSEGGDEMRRQVAAGLEERRRIGDGELEQLLGEKFPAWQDYQQTRPAWSQRQDLRAVLENAGVPLSAQQDRSLIEVMLVEQRSFAQALPPTGASPQSVSDLHQRLLGAASPILSARQMEGYRELLARQERLRRGMRMQTDAIAAAAESP